jgi:hypothetical protein
MSGELLDRSRWCAAHRQVRAERVTKSMRSTRCNARLPPCFSNVLAHDILRERRVASRHSTRGLFR